MTITLPEAHRRWLEEQAARVGSSVDRIIVDLIDEARESDETEARILAATNGPPAEPMTADDWSRLRGRIPGNSMPKQAG